MKPIYVDVKVEHRRPWWTMLYLHTLSFFHFFGMLEFDAEIAIKFIMMHARYRYVRRGRWQGKWLRYTEAEIDQAMAATK